MHRTHIIARELRGILVVVLVALMIVWLFAKLNDDRADAQERIQLANTTTSAPDTTTTTTTVVIDDNQRLCSLAAAFRTDLRGVKVRLVNLAGDPLSSSDAPPIDVGLHRDGDIPDEIREARTFAASQAAANGGVVPDDAVDVETAETTTTEAAEDNAAVPPPAIIDVDRIDPLESGLLGEPQKIALNFYTAASTLRLGLITADFDATADYFADFVQIGEPARWDLEELAESDFADRWTALASQPVVGVDATLAYIEEACSIRIGTGFVYREEPPDLPVLDQVLVPAPIDPSVDPNPPSVTIAPPAAAG
ncbi:MAG: hypothetical protein R8J94_00915 [Acidimicrobiia bacterium]|nr:hypothetical protein [Acidimicrobiia bacterium]